MCIFLHGECVQMPQEVKDVRFPNTSVIVSCELPDMGAGN